MCIRTSQLHFCQDAFHARTSLQSDLVQDGGKRSDLNRLVTRHGDRVRAWFTAAHYHVESCLAVHFVSQPSQSSQQLRTAHITRQFHAAATSTRSCSRCSRIRPGFNGASIKWHFTASRTITSISSQELPCVAISPSGNRQSAVKPPSSAGRTRKINSRSFMP